MREFVQSRKRRLERACEVRWKFGAAVADLVRVNRFFFFCRTTCFMMRVKIAFGNSLSSIDVDMMPRCVSVEKCRVNVEEWKSVKSDNESVEYTRDSEL